MGIGNFGNMMKVMNAWNTFKQNHPKCCFKAWDS